MPRPLRPALAHPKIRIRAQLRAARPLRRIRVQPPSKCSEQSIRPIRALGLILALVVCASLSPAQELLEEMVPATVYRVGAIQLEYASPQPDQPSLDAMLPVKVELRRTEVGWAEAIPGEDSEWVEVGGATGPTYPLEATGVVQVLVSVLGKLHAAGLYGVEVRPSARDFDLENERDLRPPGRESLALEVRVGRIGRVRTLAAGSRIQSDWTIDNEIHQRIRDESPLQPAGVGDEAATDLIDRRKLEDYLHRLNRRPGRRVEAALSPSETPGEAVLDYRVNEAKPWFAYAQTTNTGTRRTNRWQTRLGYTHRQLTDRDDVLSLEFLNAGLDDVNALSARYEAPFFGADRPEWMSRRRGDPEWLDWLPRDELPWWGVDQLRWEAEFGWSQAEAGDTATQLNLANDVVRSTSIRYGARLLYEAFQHRDFFVDVWSGLRFRNLSVENNTTGGEGEALLVIPRFGIRGQRRNLLSNLDLNLSIEGQVNEISASNRAALGRAATDDRYAILGFNLGYSTYLEPVLNPRAWRDPATQASSTLAHELALGFRGQYTPGDLRLIPQANGALGGLYSVRGYPQSVGVGDTIVIGTLEYRFHLPRALPVRRQPLDLPLIGDFRVTPQQVYGRPDWDLTLRAFVDFGHSVRNDRSASGTGTPERDQTLLGAGLGAELQIRSNLRARIDWAMALKDENRINSGRSGVDFGDSEIHALFSILY